MNPEIVKLYVDNSGVMFDKMIEKYDESYADLRKERYSAVEFEYHLVAKHVREVISDFGGIIASVFKFDRAVTFFAQVSV